MPLVATKFVLCLLIEDQKQNHVDIVIYATFLNYLVSLLRLECACIVTLVDVTWKCWATYLTTVC